MSTTIHEPPALKPDSQPGQRQASSRPAPTPARGPRRAHWMLAGLLILAGLLGAVVLALSTPGRAIAPSTGPAAITVEDAWARAATRTSADPSGTSAVYLRLRNGGQASDRLLGARSDVAVTTEIHQTSVEDNVMRMRPAGIVDVPAGGMLMLQPGGLHVMLIDLRRDLAAGERLTVTLLFERAGEITAEAEVRVPSGQPMQGR